jgi:hypothetical protein
MKGWRLLVILTLAAAGVSLHGAMNPCLEETRQELLDADVAFALAATERGLEGFLEFLTDGALLPRLAQRALPRAATSGPAHRSKLRLLQPGYRLSWRPLKAEVTRPGELGYTYGYWEASRPGAGSKSLHGDYMTIWKKQPDGSWKVIADIIS